MEPAWKTKTAFGSPPRVERERSGQPDRRRGVVDARGQGLAAEVGDDRRGRAFARRGVVGRDEIVLRTLRDGVAAVVRAVHGDRRAADDGRRGEGPEITVDGGRAGVRDAGAGQDGEAVAVPSGTAVTAAEAPLTSISSIPAPNSGSRLADQVARRRKRRASARGLEWSSWWSFLGAGYITDQDSRGWGPGLM